MVLRPYMSGEEINESPTLTPKRWVISFGERSLDDADEVARTAGNCELKGTP